MAQCSKQTVVGVIPSALSLLALETAAAQLMSARHLLFSLLIFDLGQIMFRRTVIQSTQKEKARKRDKIWKVNEHSAR